MNNSVRKAVIPAAGLGTRFLPATKTVPKEMLPIVDRPILLHIVEECVAAGIEDIVLVAGRGKTAIEDFFDTSYEVQDNLEKAGKTELLEKIIHLKNLANIISIRQKEALGLGHAIGCAKPIIGNNPFAVLLGDEIMVSEPGAPTATGELCNLFKETQKSSVAVMEVPKEDVSKYGIIKANQEGDNLWSVIDVVEKPSTEEAPSQLALPGRYVFDGNIFDYIENTKPGKNGEIQLTDSMTETAKQLGMFAMTVSAKRYDAGDKLGYLQANIELALKRPELSAGLKAYIKNLAQTL